MFRRALPIIALLTLMGCGTDTTRVIDLRSNTGPQGPVGQTGAMGNTGAPGTPGQTGAQGPKGDPGAPGTGVTPPEYKSVAIAATTTNGASNLLVYYTIKTNGITFSASAAQTLNLGGVGGAAGTSHSLVACGSDRFVAVSTTSGIATVIKKDVMNNLSVLQTITTRNGPVSVSCDEEGTRLYVLTRNFVQYFAGTMAGKFTDTETSRISVSQSSGADIVWLNNGLIAVSERGDDNGTTGEGEWAVPGTGQIELFKTNLMTGVFLSEDIKGNERINVELFDRQTPLGLSRTWDGKLFATIAHSYGFHGYGALINTVETAQNKVGDVLHYYYNWFQKAMCWAASLMTGETVFTNTLSESVSVVWTNDEINLVDDVGAATPLLTTPTDITASGSYVALIARSGGGDILNLYTMTDKMLTRQITVKLPTTQTAVGAALLLTN